MSFLRKLFNNEIAAPQTTPLDDARRAAPGTAPLPADEPLPAAAPVPPANAAPRWWDDHAPQPPATSLERGTAPLAPDDDVTPVQNNVLTKPGTAALDGDLLDSRSSVAPRSLIQRGLAAATLRDIGQVRAVNQDSVFALLTTVPLESSDLTVGLFIVADGMGGHDSGEVASRIAVTTVAREVLGRLILPALADGINTDMQSVIVAAVQAANQAIWNHGRAAGSDMGTTCTAALLVGHTLYVGHVGDSRLYVQTPAGLECITDDHSAVGRLIQLGQLDPEEAREHPLRSQLYRTVGQTPDISVDYIYYQLADATHLLLCSDGLWGLVDDDLIRTTLGQHAWPQDICQSLVAHANAAGGDDNISAVVVTLPGA